MRSPPARRIAMLVALGLAVGVGAGACGDDDSSEATTEPPTTEASASTNSEPTTEAATTAPEPVADPGLPAIAAGYTGWLRLNPRPIPPSASAPHGDGDKNVYVSVPRADAAAVRGGGTYPDGAIVVKAAGVGSDSAGVVAIMRKALGIDPDHGDWEFTEYSRTAPDADYSLLAEGQVCWSCHMLAEETDWVYTTLP